MKKYTQRQLVGLLKSIHEGIVFIKESAQTNGTNMVVQDCRLAIQSVDSAMETELSNQHYNTYKQLIDKAISDLDQSAKVLDEVGRKQLLDNVANILLDLDNTLQSESEVKKEIVFFPYKASMWDSMESIWKVAKEDANCECFVVPIPYITAEGIQYEGKQFPIDVPITSFQDYDLSMHKPDVIYIHNPYDNSDLVTSVIPQFFTTELKKHTGKLVYVPYFVVGGAIPNHFCNLPSMKNIDLVVVQSEQVRDVYLKYISADKVVALGSPKFDKVTYNRLNGVEVPSDWKEKITGKKVVLYNTSLAGLIENTPAYLEKLKDVVESFKNNKDMVLLWRPHPLIKSTLQSLRPNWLPVFLKIEQYFIQSNAGILDISSDPHLAIAIADAYYGDPSSIFPLFAATGKPIVLQEVSLLENMDSNKSALRFEAMAVKDEKTMYGFSSDLNALFQIDLENESLEFLGSIPNQQSSVQNLCCSMEIVGDKVVLVPYEDKGGIVPHFVEYSISKKVFSILDLQSKDTFKTPWNNDGNQQHLFSSAFKFKNSVFFVPYHYGSIVEYDVESGKCIYHRAPLDALDNNSVQNGYFRLFGCQTDNELYLPLVDSNQVLKFSMETGEFKWFRIGKKESRFSSCFSYGGSLWLASFIDGSITKYNINNSRIESQSKVPMSIKKYLNQGALFGAIIGSESEFLLIPRFGNGAVKYHTVSRKMEVTEIFPVSFPVMTGQYSKAIQFEGKAYLFNNYLRQVEKYDLTTNTTEDIRLTLSDEEVEKLHYTRRNQSRLLKTDHLPIMNLRDFSFSESLNNGTIGKYLKMILECHAKVEGQVECMQRMNANMDGTSGGMIHNFVLKNL